MTRPLLITIPLSHYCERARWALDHASIDYDEEHELQPFARPRAKSLGAPGTLPVLVVDGDVLGDSSDIVAWASSQARVSLYPKTVVRSEVESLEATFAGDFGVEARRFAYDWFLPTLGEFMNFNSGAAPSHQHVALRVMWRPMVPLIRRRFAITEERMEEAMALIRKTFDDVAARLRDGRPFLLGESFTAADLTFASMASLNLLPDSYGMPMPSLDDSKRHCAAVVRARSFHAEMRDHEAGRFALRLYDTRPNVRGRLRRPLRARIVPKTQRTVAGLPD